MSAQPAAAETIGNFIIERSLAQGSMGHVYVARHKLTYAQVALKILRPELATDAHAEERFLREVRAAAQIGHDGIVKVLDAGCDAQGRLYLAMELLHGETFEDRMAREAGQRLTLMRWIARALAPLAAAHAQSIIHRDLKPANLFIAKLMDGSEQMKLLDFGLARDTRQKSRTETGVALGTPYYMSPEQAMRPKEVGPASDVWAFGVMMYEVLSGQMPFDGETLHAVVLQSTSQPHIPLAERRPELDPALCELVEDCLRKEPRQRPNDASVLLARLLPLLDDEHVRRVLDAPVALRHGADGPEHSADTSVDEISYADTAITLPAPRIDESESSYAPRRRGSGGLLAPLAISSVLLGGATVGYLAYTPAPTIDATDTDAIDATHGSVAAQQPAQQPSRSPAEPAPDRLAVAPSQPASEALAPTPPATTSAPAPATQPAKEKTESQASSARDGRSQPSTKPAHAQRRTSSHAKSPRAELPLPDADPEIAASAEPTSDLADLANRPIPSVDAPADGETEAMDQDDAWERVDAQLKASGAQPPDAPEPAPEPEPAPPMAEPSPAPTEPEASEHDGPVPSPPEEEAQLPPAPEPPSE